MASDTSDRELIDTVAVHARWLRRDGLTDAHRVDNQQSADYLDRLTELLVLVVGWLGSQPEITPQQIRAEIDKAYRWKPADEWMNHAADAVYALLERERGATPEAEENR